MRAKLLITQTTSDFEMENPRFPAPSSLRKRPTTPTILFAFSSCSPHNFPDFPIVMIEMATTF
jgi:hypothetical protein